MVTSHPTAPTQGCQHHRTRGGGRGQTTRTNTVAVALHRSFPSFSLKDIPLIRGLLSYIGGSVWSVDGVSVTVRCAVGEKRAWVRAAGGERGLSRWVRETLDAAAGLDKGLAQASSRPVHSGAAPGSPAEVVVAARPSSAEVVESLRFPVVRGPGHGSPRRATAGALPGYCVHRMPLSGFCPRCG